MAGDPLRSILVWRNPLLRSWICEWQDCVVGGSLRHCWRRDDGRELGGYALASWETTNLQSKAKSQGPNSIVSSLSDLEPLDHRCTHCTMSRFRRPEKQLSEWEEWSMPEPSTSNTAPRQQHGWSELEGQLNTDYGLASDGQEISPPLRGPFAVPREHAMTSSSVQGQWDADSAAAFWAFPEPNVQSPTGEEHLGTPYQALQQRGSDQSQSRASYYGGGADDDDDRHSAASYRTARATAQVSRA